MLRELNYRGKVYAKCISGKQLVSQICKELFKLNNKKEPNFKMGKGSEQILHKEDMKMENKQVKRCSFPGPGFTHWWVTPSPGSPGPQLHSLVSWHYPQSSLGFFSEVLHDQSYQGFSATRGLATSQLDRRPIKLTTPSIVVVYN